MKIQVISDAGLICKYFALLLALRLVYDIYFVFHLVIDWNYLGYSLIFSAGKFSASFLLLLLGAALLPRRATLPSEVIKILLICFVILPFQTYAVWGGGFWLHLTGPFILLLLLALLDKRRNFVLPGPRFGQILFLYITGGALLTYTAYIFMGGNAVIFNLDMSRVYEYRETQKAVVQGGAAAYLGNWVVKIFLPIAGLYFYANRNRFLLASLFLLGVIFFGVNNQKSTLVFPILAIITQPLFTLSCAEHFIFVSCTFALD